MIIPIREVYDYLMEKQIEHNHLVGILCNIQGRSEFNAATVGDHGTSGGLFQHHAGRFYEMKRFAGPAWRRNWKGQVDYAVMDSHFIKFLKTECNDYNSAVRTFVKVVDKPKYAEREVVRRIKFIPMILSAIS